MIPIARKSDRPRDNYIVVSGDSGNTQVRTTGKPKKGTRSYWKRRLMDSAYQENLIQTAMANPGTPGLIAGAGAVGLVTYAVYETWEFWDALGDAVLGAVAVASGAIGLAGKVGSKAGNVLSKADPRKWW